MRLRWQGKLDPGSPRLLARCVNNPWLTTTDCTFNVLVKRALCCASQTVSENSGHLLSAWKMAAKSQGPDRRASVTAMSNEQRVSGTTINEPND